MNINDNRFRIEMLIQMAKVTCDLDKRERLIAQAEEELADMNKIYYASDSTERFIQEMCIFDTESRTDRRDIYNTFLEYCKINNLIPTSKNCLFKALRKKTREVRGKTEYLFKVALNKLEDIQDEVSES